MSLWILDTDNFSLVKYRHLFVVWCVNKVNFEETAITIIN
jgi:hypothetical protein